MRIVAFLFKIFFAIVILFVLFYVITYLSTRGNYKVAHTISTDTTLPHLVINQYTFHLETFGDSTRPVIIVLHGGPGFDYRYLYPLKRLSNEYLVVFYDQRGCGLSPRVPMNNISREVYLQDLDKIIDHFSKGKKVHMVGHSWGATLAAEYLSIYPDKVSKTVLAEPPFLNAEMAHQYMEKVNYLKPRFNMKLLGYFMKIYFQSMHIKKPDDHAGKDYFFNRLMWNTYEGHPLAGYFCRKDKDKNDIPYWRAGAIASQAIMESVLDQHGNFNINITQRTGTLQNEVLFLAGECNTLSGYRHQQKHADLFVNSNIEEIPGSGHFLFNDQPEYSISVIRNFLNK